jgi:hypothetical protein
MIRLTNTRRWLLAITILQLIGDARVVYPGFNENKFSNKIAIVIIGVVTWLTVIGLIHSYMTNKLNSIYVMVIFTVLKAQVGTFNMPGPEVGHNYIGRMILK